MARILSDQEIANLLTEPKPLPQNWETRLKPKPKKGFPHEERQLDCESDAGRKFRLIVRRNRLNQLDFSIILIYEDEGGAAYRLTRYNGKHPSRHTNKFEKREGMQNASFDPNFHIHRATQRYQESGYSIDGYAEVTDTYTDYNSALDEFMDGCAFQRPQELQPRLV